MSLDKRRRTLEQDGAEILVQPFGSKWTYIKEVSEPHGNGSMRKPMSVGIHRDEIPWVIAQLAASDAGLPQLPAILAALFELDAVQDMQLHELAKLR